MRPGTRAGNAVEEPREESIDLPSPYTGRLLCAPVEEGMRRKLLDLLRHKGQPWLADIRARLVGAGGRELYAVALRDDQPVAHAWLSSSEGCPEVGWIGHVFTSPDHRRHGLAGGLMEGLVDRFDRWGGRWLALATGNQAAARIYRRVGFRVVQGDPEADHAVMMRSEEEADWPETYAQNSGEWTVEPLALAHCGALSTFLGAWPGENKLPVLNVDTGLEAEEALVRACQRQADGEISCAVLVDAETGRPHGVSWLREATLEVFAPGLGTEAERTFIQQSLWMAEHPREED
ncbi:MAG: GNAT family N-acetyltransferase [Planctomycetota bacterium]